MIGPLTNLTEYARMILPPTSEEVIRADFHIRWIAANYHLKTELYDLTLPGFWSKHEEWIPRGDYLGDSAKFASRYRKEATTGFGREEIKKFQQYTKEYARFSLEELKRESERLENLLKT